MMDDDFRRELRDSARRLLERSYAFDARTAALKSESGYSTERWQQFAELGWLALGLPESCGGLGGLAEQFVLAEELGRALVVEPWLAHMGLAAPLLAEMAGEPGRRSDLQDLLERAATGEAMLALAAHERQGRHDAFDCETRAVRVEAATAGNAAVGWRLDGRKTLALGGGSASDLLVLARCAGNARDREGLAVFRVPRASAGLNVIAQPTYDARQVADVILDGVQLDAGALIGEAGAAWPMVERALDRAAVLHAAECVGTMQRCLDLTRDYLRQRRQFGRAIIENQVVKHRLVDWFVAIEQSRAIAEAAVAAFDGGAEARIRAVSLARAFIAPAARRLGEDAVQLHGAIGMTDDLEIGQAAKRLVAAMHWFGDVPWHHARLWQDAAATAGEPD